MVLLVMAVLVVAAGRALDLTTGVVVVDLEEPAQDVLHIGTWLEVAVLAGTLATVVMAVIVAKLMVMMERLVLAAAAVAVAVALIQRLLVTVMAAVVAVSVFWGQALMALQALEE